MTIPSGSIGGNRLAQELKHHTVKSGIRDTRVTRTTGTLLAIYDAETLKEEPPPQWVLDKLKAEGNRRLWAKVTIEGYESSGDRYIPISTPVSLLGDGNGQSMVERAKEEFSLVIELPNKNIELARLVGFAPKSPRKVMTGREQPPADTAGPVSPMLSSRVFSILGV